MTRKLASLATAAIVSVSAVPAAHAMEMELNMLTGAIYNALRAYNISADEMMSLTLSQVGQIKGCMGSGESEGEIKACIQAAIRR